MRRIDTAQNEECNISARAQRSTQALEWSSAKFLEGEKAVDVPLEPQLGELCTRSSGPHAVAIQHHQQWLHHSITITSKHLFTELRDLDDHAFPARLNSILTQSMPTRAQSVLRSYLAVPWGRKEGTASEKSLNESL